MTTPTPQQPFPAGQPPREASGPPPYPSARAYDSGREPDDLPPVPHSPAGQRVPQPAAAAPAAGPAPAAAHRTGSPIIPPGIQPALLTVVLAALTGGAALLDRWVLVVPAVLLQGLTAAGWFRLNGMWPARQGIALAFLAGLVADAALLIAPAGRAPGVLLGTLGVWIPLVIVQQMRHGGSPDERLTSLTATCASTVLTVLAAGFLAQGGHPVAVGAAGVAVAVLVRALPLPAPVTVPLAVLLAAGAGWAVVHQAGWPASWTTVGAVAGLCAVIGIHVASYDWPSRFVHFTAGIALPLTLTAPALWTAAHLLHA